MRRSRISFFALQLRDLISHYERVFPLVQRDKAPIELARALSISPLLRDNPMVVAVREKPPIAAFVGDLDASPSLRSLPQQVGAALRRTRYVDYRSVELAVEQLAHQLVGHLGRDTVDAARYVAIPRGGHIVLGLLSYALGLPRHQMEPESDGDVVVVVDDCSLSGLRFRDTIGALRAETVIFAPLFSHPDLRKAIEASESKVLSCLSGGDLIDVTERLDAEERVTWRRTWEETNKGYWTGQPEHVVFPWSEPDIGIMDAETHLVSQGWYIAPPSLCLHHRALVAATGQRSSALQVITPGQGDIQLADSALYVSLGNDIAVLDLEHGQSWELNGVAADMWLALLQQASLDRAVETIVSRYRVDEESARDDLIEFIEQLSQLGLVVRT